MSLKIFERVGLSNSPLKTDRSMVLCFLMVFLDSVSAYCSWEMCS
jgi:hypothetical protein